jgi:hypothetical protein
LDLHFRPSRAPLYNITNFVVMQQTATLLALGACRSWRMPRPNWTANCGRAGA